MLQQDIPDYLAMPDMTTDNMLDKALQTPAPVALLKTLQDGGVEQIDLSGRDMTTSAARIRAVLGSGHEALQANDITPPNLEHFYTASDLVKSEGLGLDAALAQVRAQEPLSVSKQDLMQAAGEQNLSPTPQNWHPPLALGQSPASQSSPATDTIALTPEQQYTATELAHDALVEKQIGNTNFCEMSVEDQFQNFIRWQGTEREASEDFISERITSKSWEELPIEIQNYEPNLKNVLGFRNPYSGMVDDMGAHTENQRFPGGYHIASEEGHLGVDVHFDAHDPLYGPIPNGLHFLEVRALANGDIKNIHYPHETTGNEHDEGRFPDWEHYEEYCAGL